MTNAEEIARAAGFTPKNKPKWWFEEPGHRIGKQWYQPPLRYTGPQWSAAECQEHLVPVLTARGCYVGQCSLSTRVSLMDRDSEPWGGIISEKNSFPAAVTEAIIKTAKEYDDANR